jgi:CheY-like chemotaxis protein
MPIVDGLTSTKMIRSFEKVNPEGTLATRPLLNGRVPIFAVSASLVERERQTYIDAGFDGWILKPIDFKRLGVLLEGIVDEEVRNTCLYKPGEWERGGWFNARHQSIRQANTKPSQKNPVHEPYPNAPPGGQSDGQSDAQSGSSSGTGSTSESGTSTIISGDKPKAKPLIHDERLDSPITPDSSPPRKYSLPPPDTGS